MNPNMLSHAETQANINKLMSRGHTVVNPDCGLLACGYEGQGRLPSKEVINEYVWRALYPKRDLEGLNVLITAGPTHEYIDPVRFISNPSSGKMGYALAKQAWYRGANVTLISGPTSLPVPVGVNFVKVITAEEMYDACIKNAPTADIMIKAAAVGDFRVEKISSNKIKRDKDMSLTLNLVQNKDIAAKLGEIKREGQTLVGFAAETQNFVGNARKKIESKKLDMIAVNDVLSENIGFESDNNKISLIIPGSNIEEIEGTKEEVADALFDAIILKRQGC
jgi:phosphopantothenoylcysteine decarboxylase/phosphopantothenate--cysteine ligase